MRLLRKVAKTNMGRLIDREELRDKLKTLHTMKIVFTNGCFDLIHIGHIRLLNRCRQLGDIVIVGLNSDVSVRRVKGEKHPVIPEEHRAEILSAMSSVDLVVMFDEETPLELVKLIRPDVLVKGGDYSEDEIVGAEQVRSWGGEVEIFPFVEGVSTTGLINRIIESFKTEQ